MATGMLLLDRNALFGGEHWARVGKTDSVRCDRLVPQLRQGGEEGRGIASYSSAT